MYKLSYCLYFHIPIQNLKPIFASLFFRFDSSESSKYSDSDKERCVRKVQEDRYNTNVRSRCTLPEGRQSKVESTRRTYDRFKTVSL